MMVARRSFCRVWTALSLQVVGNAFVTVDGFATTGPTTSRAFTSTSASRTFTRSAFKLAASNSPPDFSVLDDDGSASSNESSYSPPDSSKPVDASPLADSKPARKPKRSKEFPSRPRRSESKRPTQEASWMQRNAAYTNTPEEEVDSRRGAKPNRTFKQDFRGTRVFVQNLPPQATWQDLKDHFRVAGEVVFASVSADPVTGRSKGCGVVQYETTEMAETAISIMRNHPLDGSQLYVREDVQERSGEPTKKGPTPPSTWKCANEENASILDEDERKAIVSLIKARDDARRRKQYDASDAMREELKQKYNVHVDDRLKMWWTAVDGNQVPDRISDIKGDGRWGKQSDWRQIPTSKENDICVNSDLVNGLLKQRDVARKEKDFGTADMLLEKARTAPDGDLNLRIHDESRTWRIWTEAPPPRAAPLSAVEECLTIVQKFDPHKLEEMEAILEKFPGREYNILKKLKQRYNA